MSDLVNNIQRDLSDAAFVATDKLSTFDCVTFDSGESQGVLYRKVLDAVEKGVLESLIKTCNGNQSKMARMLGLNRATLRAKLARLGFTD